MTMALSSTDQGASLSGTDIPSSSSTLESYEGMLNRQIYAANAKNGRVTHRLISYIT